MYAYWPGATRLGAVRRIFLFLSAPATALAMWYLSTRAPGWPEPARTTPLQAPPPPQCRSFDATASPDTDTSATASGIAASVVHNVDAMTVAATVNLPTINGHASFLPADWDCGKPADADYPSRVARYAGRHGIAALCRLDLVTLRRGS